MEITISELIDLKYALSYAMKYHYDSIEQLVKNDINTEYAEKNLECTQKLYLKVCKEIAKGL